MQPDQEHWSIRLFSGFAEWVAKMFKILGLLALMFVGTVMFATVVSGDLSDPKVDVFQKILGIALGIGVDSAGVGLAIEGTRARARGERSGMFLLFLAFVTFMIQAFASALWIYMRTTGADITQALANFGVSETLWAGIRGWMQGIVYFVLATMLVNVRRVLTQAEVDKAVEQQKLNATMQQVNATKAVNGMLSMFTAASNGVKAARSGKAAIELETVPELLPPAPAEEAEPEVAPAQVTITEAAPATPRKRASRVKTPISVPEAPASTDSPYGNHSTNLAPPPVPVPPRGNGQMYPVSSEESGQFASAARSRASSQPVPPSRPVHDGTSMKPFTYGDN